MLRRRPEAIVVTGGKHTLRGRKLLVKSGIPVIETWDLPRQPIRHVVGFSNAEATSKLVHYLHKKGYRRIAFIGCTSNRDTCGADRRAGYEAAMVALGLLERRVISFGSPPISMKQGGEAIARLIEQWPEVEAAICVSDLSAFGALVECQWRNWNVPKRIAITGFGDFEISSCCHPTLTTVGVNCYAIGHHAGKLLLRAIEAERTATSLSAETIITGYEVIGRASA